MGFTLREEKIMEFGELKHAMDRYRCIKCVSAAQITTLKAWPDGVLDMELVTSGGKVLKTRMPADWNHKHSPEKGGYLVMYDDMYISYSPESPFKAGYVELTENEGSDV